MKQFFGVILILLLVFAVIRIATSTYENIKRKNNPAVQNQETAIVETGANAAITPIPVDNVKGITAQEAEALCCRVMGERDEETGFVFSFGTSGAVQREEKQYYVIRVSWLVNNDHLSYIGDLFVSADGKEIYDGVVTGDKYEMMDLRWKKQT